MSGCGAGEPTGFSRPSHVRVQADGGLLVADFQNHRVVRLADGEPQLFGRQGLGEGELWRVRGLDAPEDGGVVVVNFRLEHADDQNTPWREIKRFDAAGRETLAFPVLAPGQEGFGWPSGVAVVPEGYVVSDADQGSLLLFDEAGGFVRALAEGLEGPRSPRYAEGLLWVAEYKAHRIRAYTLDGEERLRLGEEGGGAGQLRFPWSVDASAEQIVVADLGNYRVQAFDWQGAPTWSVEPEAAGPRQPPQLMDVALGEGGVVWVADSKGDRVLNLDAQREVSSLSSW